MSRRRHEYPSERYDRLKREALKHPDAMPCFVDACVWPASCKHLTIAGEVAICARTWKAPTRILAPEVKP